jgi:hypothetical protein
MEQIRAYVDKLFARAVGRDIRQKRGTTTIRCQVVGCETEVPPWQWPSDPDLPVLCDEHLRATQTTPRLRPINHEERK